MTPPLTSPTTSQRRRNKRKKGGIGKDFKTRRVSKKVRNLTEVLNPVPFIPRALDLHKHENVLKRLGLYDFSNIELDRSIRTDLLVQLIVNYDSKKRCSYVNETRIRVSRSDLARALQLPDTKQNKGSSKVDSEVFSAEAIGFIEDFVFNWMLLHEESWVMPEEIVNWTRCIREGHPEKLDSSSLIWYKVKKELSQGDKLVDCYYASHLQHLIRSQQCQLLEVDDGGDGVEDEEKVEAYEHEEKPEYGEKEEKASIAKEVDVELTLGPDVEKVVHQDVREDETMVEAEECKEDMEVEEMEEQVNRKKDLGEHILQRCQSSDLINYEEIKVEDVVDEQIEQVVEMEEQVNWKNDLGERIFQSCESNDLNNYEKIKAEDVVDEQIEQVEEMEEHLNRKNDLGERILQRCESSDLNDYEVSKIEDVVDEQIIQVEEMEEQVNRKKDLGEHILQRCQSSDLINHEEIKVEDVVDEQIEQVEEMEEQVNWKNDLGERILQRCESSDLNDYEVSKVEEVVYEKIELVDDYEEEEEGVGDDGEQFVAGFDMDANDDFGLCMVQMHQWLDKAKVIQDSKEEIYVNSKYHQDSAINELRHRHQVMEMIIKSKDEELAQKHAEVFRLERELYLMGDLLAGYRKALKDTRFKFSEYRKRSTLQQEPLKKIHDNDASLESVLHYADESKEKGGGEEH